MCPHVLLEITAVSKTLGAVQALVLGILGPNATWVEGWGQFNGAGGNLLKRLCSLLFDCDYKNENQIQIK